MKNIAATQNQRPQTSRHVSWWSGVRNDVIALNDSKAHVEMLSTVNDRIC